MFSRRHPYLFFMLIFSGIFSSFIVILTMLIVIGASDSTFETGEVVGVVEINGVIADSKEILKNIVDFRKNSDVKAIVIRINSPGGGVGASQEIYAEIVKTSKVKKVIASFGGVAASGGYYVASAADGIISSQGTITGSIGVIMAYTNFKELLDKIGLVPVVIKSGEYKDVGSPVRDLTEKDKAILQSLATVIHNQFISDVAAGRKMEIEKVTEIADGRIFSGAEAKDLGLVDKIGNFEDAVEWAGRLGGIKGEIVAVYPKQDKLSFLKYLAESSVQNFITNSFSQSLKADYLYKP
ncbi:MAG: signal peptide peptidase SppA [Desulfobacterales bacterium]|nr:signal peptide peptidase SppA [Desulfobacterales bacterium]